MTRCRHGVCGWRCVRRCVRRCGAVCGGDPCAEAQRSRARAQKLDCGGCGGGVVAAVARGRNASGRGQVGRRMPVDLMACEEGALALLVLRLQPDNTLLADD